ncbi:fimbrial protein [Siccibacter turicensis]|uniref:fimbrial protein n=1 Tax=Siccibacter turicensis TaxID=357233 RepID=UPI0004630D35|nr:type 1 fimbrial protein [Siccibacter turicensis]
MNYRRRGYFPVTTLVLWILAAGVLAAGADGDNWNVEGMNGGLLVRAALYNSPCHLSTDSAEQEIVMNAVPQFRLHQPGDRSQPIAVHLTLEDCMLDSSVRSPEHGNNVTLIPMQPVVFMNVIGEEDPSDHRLFRVHGDAQGVGLHLEDSAHRRLIPGERSWPQILMPGRNDLMLLAQLSRTAEPLVLGSYRAVINIGLEYE